MNKRIVNYRERHTVRNGAATIALGTSAVEARGPMLHVLENVIREAEDLVYYPQRRDVKGVAKLHPEDVDNAVTGKIVASEKAEIQGLRLGVAQLGKFAKDLTEALSHVDAQISVCLGRIKELEDDVKSR